MRSAQLVSPRNSFGVSVFGVAVSIWAVAFTPLALRSQDKTAAAPQKTSQTLPVQIAPQSAPGTQPAATSNGKPSDLSKEAVVFDKLYTKIREETDGTGTRQTTARIRVLADAGVKQMAVLTFTFTASNQQIDIGYVRVIKPDGSVVVTPDYNVQDLPADVTREAPMYSDIHQKHVAVRGLGVGDTLEYQVMLHTTKPDVPGQFWLEYEFEKNLIVLDEQLDLDLPADKAVRVASDEVQPTISSASGRKLYHWSSSNLARPDPDAPPKSEKNLKPSVQVTTFKNWEEVGAWYASLQEPSLVITPAIKARADALTKGMISDEDKINAIFNDVALHIHYVALEFGIGRYQPHSADDVLANEYGDCKDKHTLLAAMLKAAGIDAWPVLIASSRDLDPATPSPAQFDHVITLVKLKDKTLWMDSTEEVAPVGSLIGTLRDKQALAIPDGKPAYLERTPADLPYPQVTRIEVTGAFTDEGTFTGHFTESYHGDGEYLLRNAFRAVPESQWKTFLQNVSNATGFAGDVSNPVVSPIEQTAKPLEFSYDYKREKYGEWDSKRITPPFPPIGYEMAPGIKQIKPADDVDLGSPGELVYKATVKLPKGWELYPEQPTNLVEDWAEYHSKYTFKDGTFTAERRLVIKKDKMPLADWEKYLEFRRGIYGDEVETNAISSSGEAESDSTEAAGGNATPGSTAILNLGSSPVMQQMIVLILPLRDVVSTLLSDQPQTPDELKKAAADSQTTLDLIESKSRDLSASDASSLYWAKAISTGWCVKGWSALALNDLPTAETYLRAAWKLNQDPLSGYLLGWLLELKQARAAAAHQYELAYVASNSSIFGVIAPPSFDIQKRISDGYKRVTGRQISATPFKNGAYNGSLQQELDLSNEIHGFNGAGKLSGEGLYSVDYSSDKPATVSMLSGDKPLEKLAPLLQSKGFAALFPNGSKARLLREVRIVCSPYAGCDVYQLLPGSIRIPSKEIHIVPTKVAPSSGSKSIEIKRPPVQTPK